jgi:hypothetical protein
VQKPDKPLGKHLEPALRFDRFLWEKSTGDRAKTGASFSQIPTKSRRFPLRFPPLRNTGMIGNGGQCLHGAVA